MKTLIPPPITPGPWTVKNYELTGSNGKPVVLSNAYIGLGSSTSYPDGPHNSKLFHAAPAMAEALEEVVNLANHFPNAEVPMTVAIAWDKCRKALIAAGYTIKD